MAEYLTDEFGKAYELPDKERITIGRNHKSDIQIPPMGCACTEENFSNYLDREFPSKRDRANRARAVRKYQGVSRKHAVIQRGDGFLGIRDNGSSVGTALNGQRVGTEIEELHHGYDVLLGFLHLRYVVEGGEE